MQLEAERMPRLDVAQVAANVLHDSTAQRGRSEDGPTLHGACGLGFDNALPAPGSWKGISTAHQCDSMGLKELEIISSKRNGGDLTGIHKRGARPVYREPSVTAALVSHPLSERSGLADQISGPTIANFACCQKADSWSAN